MLFLSKITIQHIFYFGDHTTKKKISHMRLHKLQLNLGISGNFNKTLKDITGL